MCDQLKQNLVIIGCGGTAEMIADCFDSSPMWEVSAFSVEQRYWQPSFMGKPVIPYENLENEFSKEKYYFFVGIGENALNKLRYRFYLDMLSKGWNPATFISAKATLSDKAIIGKHCFISENVVIQAGCEVGENVIFLPNSFLAHHSRIGNHVFCSGGVNISGFASIGDFSFLGSNAAVSNCIQVGRRGVIGMGCVCSKDIPDDCAMISPHCSIYENARGIFNKWRDKAASKARKILSGRQADSIEPAASKPIMESSYAGQEPEASLLAQIAATPRYRANGLWSDARNLVIFAHKDKVDEASQAVAEYCPEANIIGICAHKGEKSHYEIKINSETRKIPALDPASLASLPDCLGVIYWSGCIVPDTLYYLGTAAARSLNLCIFPRIPFGTGRRLDASLYESHGKKLEDIYHMLSDSESRLSFASVLKALLTGDIEWIRPAICQEYQYPAAKADKGDIVLDAGLYDSAVLRRFALEIGDDGHVYGFEPEPDNFELVKTSLKKFGDPGNITLIRKGVYSERRKMHISGAGASCSLGEEGSICETVDIDSFVREHALPRVDLIKMDIEGAEMSALAGAVDTISRWRPKLHICAYHREDDIVEIPEFINRIAPGYEFYFAAHAPFLNEYVYYAVPKQIARANGGGVIV